MDTAVKLKPTGRRVIVRVPRDPEARPAGGIILPEDADSTDTAVVEVIAVGPDVDSHIHPGCQVIMGRWKGNRIGETLGHDSRELDLRVVAESEILGLVED